MKILITGATGFVGGCILQYFSDIYGKENVHGTGRDKFKADNLISNGFNIKLGDLADTNFIVKHLSSYDLIIHCAAKSSIWGTYDSFYFANIISTQNLLRVLGPEKQLIYISTANIYFEFKNRLNIRESEPLPSKFSNYYAETKYKAEQLVLEFAKKSYVTILRPRAIIGVGDTVVFPRLLRAHDEGRLRIVGDGQNIIDLTSINNLCHAIKLSVDHKEKANGEIYNVTNGDCIKLWDQIRFVLSSLEHSTELKSVPYKLAYLFAKFQEITTSKKSKEPALSCYGVGILNYSISLSIDKIKEHLGYLPQESTKQTMNSFIAWYKETNN